MHDTHSKVIQAGLSRSGSTVAWQTCKSLIEPNPVEKTHDFNNQPGIPVVITIRNPADAALSYHQASDTEGSKPNISAFGPVFGSAPSILEWHKKHKGPKLLIRYEDWFPSTTKMISQISEFLQIRLSDRQILELANNHSYTANHAIASKVGSWDDYDQASYIHGRHCNGGEIGKARGKFSEETLIEARTALSEFLDTFGYTI